MSVAIRNQRHPTYIAIRKLVQHMCVAINKQLHTMYVAIRK